MTIINSKWKKGTELQIVHRMLLKFELAMEQMSNRQNKAINLQHVKYRHIFQLLFHCTMYVGVLSLTSALDGGVWLTPIPRGFTCKRTTVPTVWETAWASGLVSTGVGSLTPPTKVQTQNCPGCSESL